MPTLLRIDSSPLSSSVSRELTAEFARTWQAVHPFGKVIHRDLYANPIPVIDEHWIGAAYTPEGSRTPEQVAALALSDQLIGELVQADEYVIGVAMHNLTIPSVLKLWIDQVVRKGLTFSYDEVGPKGLLVGKKATVLAATGGVYAPGTEAASLNHIEPYLRSLLAFLGVTDVKFVTASGTARLMSHPVSRAQFLKPVLDEVRASV
jgi:FMN-dependent NADH-azoreductase